MSQLLLKGVRKPVKSPNLHPELAVDLGDEMFVRSILRSKNDLDAV